ncbi:MAG: DUF2157 domain-containing protein [Thermoanaerobaculia bacterium]
MQPEIAAAVERLERANVIPSPTASFLFRVARREIVSIRLEIRAALYAGIALIAAGAGLFVKEHSRDIGPVAITLALSLACAGSFAYVLRRAPGFSWQRVPSPTLAFDYILLLSVLLFGLDLAYVETQFRIFGPNWPYHLLLFSLICLAAAYRFDSAAVLSLALTSFAAWRGVAAKSPLDVLFASPTSRIRWNAILCGVLFAAGALWAARSGRKAHFEAVWANLGLLLLFGGLLSGVLNGENWRAWEVPLLVVSAAVLAAGLRFRRELPLAQAVLAGYVGALKIALRPLHNEIAALAVLTVSTIGVLAALLLLHRAVKARHAR